MNNEPMYNAFINNREQADNRSSNSKDRRRNKRIKEDDLPEFDYDLEEPGEGGFTPGPVVGVDRTIGSHPEFLRPDVEEESSDACDGPITREPFEFEGGCVSLPHPDVFNSYPPEVQRKIMEWTDRDIRARRDDESRRQDAILRANIAREKTKMGVPVAIVILSIICAAITGLYTRDAAFVIAFLTVAVVVIVVIFVSRLTRGKRGHSQSQHPKV